MGYHLKQNLWLGEHDFIALDDDIAVDVHVAMAAHRDSVDGEKVPGGILTEIKGTAVGRLIEEIERRTEAGAIGTGLELLKLSSQSANYLSRAIDKIAADAAKDGKSHDVTVASGQAGSGITVHCSGLPNDVAARQLQRHCELRKYSVKATKWFGLVIQPGKGAIRLGLMLDYRWEQDAAMDAAVAKMPTAASGCGRACMRWRPQPASVDDLRDRLLMAQALETVRCLDEGVITDPSEADVGALLGWGFAPWTGGPLSYIDAQGVAAFVARCDELTERYGSSRLLPPEALRRIAAEGGTIYSTNWQRD